VVELRSLFKEKPYDALITIANIITFLGIIFIGIYVREFLSDSNRWVMFVSLFLAGLSDLLDGEAARRLKQITRIGEFLDPLRDRLLLIAVLANILYIAEIKYIFLVGLIVGCEILTAVCNLILLPPQKRKVHIVGKLRQAAHLLLAGLVVLSFYFKDIIFGITNINFNFPPDLVLPLMAACSFVALFFYVFSAKITDKKIISNHKE